MMTTRVYKDAAERGSMVVVETSEGLFEVADFPLAWVDRRSLWVTAAD